MKKINITSSVSLLALLATLAATRAKANVGVAVDTVHQTIEHLVGPQPAAQLQKLAVDALIRRGSRKGNILSSRSGQNGWHAVCYGYRGNSSRLVSVGFGAAGTKEEARRAAKTNAQSYGGNRFVIVWETYDAS